MRLRANDGVGVEVLGDTVYAAPLPDGPIMVLEGIEPLVLEHALCFIGEQHGVAVEGDADLVRVVGAGQDGLHQHARGWNAGGQRLAHILGIGREEKMGAQRPQVAKR